MNDIGRQLLNNGHGNHEANLGEVCCENLCDFICEMYFVTKMNAPTRLSVTQCHAAL